MVRRLIATLGPETLGQFQADLDFNHWAVQMKKATRLHPVALAFPSKLTIEGGLCLILPIMNC